MFSNTTMTTATSSGEMISHTAPCDAPHWNIRIISNRCVFALEQRDSLHVRDADGDSQQIMSTTTTTACVSWQIVVYLGFFVLTSVFVVHTGAIHLFICFLDRRPPSCINQTDIHVANEYQWLPFCFVRETTPAFFFPPGHNQEECGLLPPVRFWQTLTKGLHIKERRPHKTFNNAHKQTQARTPSLCSGIMRDGQWAEFLQSESEFIPEGVNI